MRKEVITGSPDDTIQEIASRMRDRNVGSVIVVTENRPIGVLTDRDITVDVVSRGSDPSKLTAADVMTSKVFSLEEDTGIYQATRKFFQEGYRRAPVVKNGELVGIITLDDLVVLLSGELQNLAEVIRLESS